jgi:hypothetical protein
MDLSDVETTKIIRRLNSMALWLHNLEGRFCSLRRSRVDCSEGTFNAYALKLFFYIFGFIINECKSEIFIILLFINSTSSTRPRVAVAQSG